MLLSGKELMHLQDASNQARHHLLTLSHTMTPFHAPEKQAF